MATTAWLMLRRGLDIDINQPDDPRVGSGRDDSSGGGTLSAESGSKSSSLSKLGATFIPVLVVLAVCLIVFTLLRPRCQRVYAPRTIQRLREPELSSTPLPSGLFDWIVPFFRTPDSFVLNHGSLDGFFFLRYLKMLRNICFAGCCITWPVLFPLHITGGNGETELERLTLGNVANMNKLYAHVLVAWVFFGFVLALIARECIFYVNLRQAYLSSPYYSQRLSSRTMLITCVPPLYCDEARLRKLYGDSAMRIWIPRTSKALVKLVKEREQTASRLEKAEVQLIRKANAARNKWLQSNKHGTHATSGRDTVEQQEGPQTGTTSEMPKGLISPVLSDSTDNLQRDEILHVIQGSRINIDADDRHTILSEQQQLGGKGQPGGEEEATEYIHPYGLELTLPDLRGSVAAKWIPAEARPHHRPLGNFGRRVDTIRWTRNRLRELNLQIFKLRRRILRGDGTTLPAAFIEFDTQESAQAAHQVLAHHRPLQMSTRLLGIRQEEVIWDSLRMTWWERIVRRTLMLALVTAAIIFWSIPSAFIGLVSNIQFLSNIFFLRWLNLLPDPILSFLQGFIPAMALSLWMALVPAMLRALAAQAGAPSVIVAELFTQNAYFAFQVVQVFLVTTLTSAASGALTEVIKNPVGITDLLAKNLPRSSNFYLSYILIQCLASGGFSMLQILQLVRHTLLPRVSVLPSSQFRVWSRLRVIYWGGVFPVFTNMGVIAISYACIAPLILVFAAGGMWFIRIVWKYNLIYVFDSTIDSKGLFYPRALLHLIIGLYMAEVCLIGLFALKKAVGPVVLMVLFLVLSGLVHLTLSDAIAPLLQNLPQTLVLEDEVQAGSTGHADTEHSHAGAAASYYDVEEAFGDETEQEDHGQIGHEAVTDGRALEGASSVRSALLDWLRARVKSKAETEAHESGVTQILSKLGFRESEGAPPNFVTRWLHPDDFVTLRRGIPSDLLHIDRTEDNRLGNYLPPELWKPKPILWIPRDEARVSRQEVAHSRPLVAISDLGASLDSRGRVTVIVEESPLRQRRSY